MNASEFGLRGRRITVPSKPAVLWALGVTSVLLHNLAVREGV